MRSSRVVALVGTSSPGSSRPQASSLWSKQAASDTLSYQHFLEDPAGWWWRKLGHPEDRGLTPPSLPLNDKHPGPAEQALAGLEAGGFVHHVITQAADGSHHRAGSHSVTELHGNEGRLRCIECTTRFDVKSVPLHPMPPRCPNCQGLIKTDALLTGEGIPVDTLAQAKDWIARCDALIVINTLGLVHPAANFPLAAHRRGAWLVEVSPRESQLTGLCDGVVTARPESALPYLLERVKALRQGVATD